MKLCLCTALLSLLATAGLATAAPQGVPAIVFSSDRGHDLLTVHRYSILPNGHGRRELPSGPIRASSSGVVSPDGQLVARVAGTPGDPSIEVTRPDGTMSQTVISHFATDPGVTPGNPNIVWSPDSQRLAAVVPRSCIPRMCPGSDIWAVRRDGRELVHAGRGRQVAWSSDSGRLVFVRYDADFFGDTLFAANATTGSSHPLARGTRPTWAPRSHLIAYVLGQKLKVVDADVSGSQRTLAVGWVEAFPSWSSDGRQVAAVIVHDEHRPRRELLVVDVRSGAARTVVHAAVPYDLLALPVFSPNGKQLAYAATTRQPVELGSNTRWVRSGVQIYIVPLTQNGPPHQVTHELPWALFETLEWTHAGRLVYNVEQFHNDRELWVVNPDGSDVTRLTDNLFEDSQPSWSPNGLAIVFERSNPFAVYPAPKRPGIYMLDLVTHRERFLASVAPDDNSAAPAWSPDGSTIAYTSGAVINFIHPDGTVAGQVTARRRPQHPSWSPDGMRLAFSDFTDGSTQALFVIGRDGSGLTKITAFNQAFWPAWSPDGQWIAFWCAPGGAEPAGLWLVHPDGSDPHPLVATTHLGSAAPAWSPDSSKIVYDGEIEPGVQLGRALYVVDVDGTNNRLLTADGQSANSAASWHR